VAVRDSRSLGVNLLTLSEFSRSTTHCTSEEGWTKYITLNRNGSANLLEAASRTFNPIHIFDELKWVYTPFFYTSERHI
jgi:hypothetical protein